MLLFRLRSNHYKHLSKRVRTFQLKREKKRMNKRVVLETKKQPSTTLPPPSRKRKIELSNEPNLDEQINKTKTKYKRETRILLYTLYCVFMPAKGGKLWQHIKRWQQNPLSSHSLSLTLSLCSQFIAFFFFVFVNLSFSAGQHSLYHTRNIFFFLFIL